MLKITVLKYGESVFGEDHIFKGGRPDVELPISFVFYLIETDNKKILIDVGCNDGAGFVMSVFDKPVNILKEYGVLPENITDVVITHHHHDHIEAIKDYSNATIHIQKDEYEKGRDYFPASFKMHTFNNEFLLYDKIIVRKIGGHSIGSSIVICKEEGKNYIFCGDECYVKASLEKLIPIGGSLYPEISERFLKEYSGTNNVPLLFHDPDILKGRIGYQTIFPCEIPA